MEPVTLAAWFSIGLALLVAGAALGWFCRAVIANRNEARLGRVIEELLDDVNRFHLDGEFDGVGARL